MPYRITTPDDHTLEVEEEDRKYFAMLEAKGYKIEKLPNVCHACEG